MNGADEFNCICYAGFDGKICEIDHCDGVICENGFCDAGECSCNNGYIKIGSICKETCEMNPCEVVFVLNME